MIAKFPVILLLGLVFFIVAGCGWEQPTTAQTPKTSVAPKQNDTTPKEVGVELVSWEEVQAIVAANKGKIVVVDMWSTWCEPCVKEFPHFVALQKKFPDDVVCLSLNCNYIGDDSLEEERAGVREFLAKHPSSVRHLMSKESDEILYKKVGIASIPVARVYSRTGKLHQQFDNESNAYGEDGFHYEKHIVPQVEKLVKDKAQDQ